MRFRTTLVLFALAAAIFAFIKFYESKRPNTEEANRRAQNVINFERDKIDGVVIQNGEERIELKRGQKMATRIPGQRSGRWQYRRQLIIRSGRLEKRRHHQRKRNRGRQEPDGGIRRGQSEASAQAPRRERAAGDFIRQQRRSGRQDLCATGEFERCLSRCTLDQEPDFEKTRGISRSQINRHDCDTGHTAFAQNRGWRNGTAKTS